MRRCSLFVEQRSAEAFVNLDGTEHAWILYDRAPARICLSRFAFGEARILPAEGVDNKIVKLDSRDSKIVHVVSEPYYPRAGYECFSREAGRFAVTAPEVSGTGTSYQNMVYRWIEDWDQPAHFTDFKTLEWWNTNPHDCTAVDFKAAASIQPLSATPLVHEQTTSGEDGHERIGRANAAPSAPSRREAAGRNAASPAGPSLTPDIARLTGAKASGGTAIAL